MRGGKGKDDPADVGFVKLLRLPFFNVCLRCRRFQFEDVLWLKKCPDVFAVSSQFRPTQCLLS